MALIVFLSGLGMAVSKHYCSSQLRDMKFFQKAETCVVLQEQVCETSQGISITNEPCCKSENLYFLESTDKVSYAFSYDLNWDFDFDYFAIFSEHIIYLSEIIIIPDNFRLLDKPMVYHDIPIWNQSFLI